ncbi:MAG: NAD-dependent epimerase/dehydratase family protein, partial [Acidimicrobiales bacterium]
APQRAGRTAPSPVGGVGVPVNAPAERSIGGDDLARTCGEDLPWERLEGRTVLVSGASGFLAAYMVEVMLHLNRTVLRRPVRVIAMVRDAGRAEARFAAYADRPELRIVVHDVCLPLELTESVDYVVHAASQTSPLCYGIDPVATLGANLFGTHHLLELARANGATGFLFFSSSEVYGQVESSAMPVAEDTYGFLDPLSIRSCYAESKRVGETMCASWHHQHGVPVTIVRPFHTYGPGMRLDDGRAHADFVTDIVAGRNVIVRSDGQAARSFCYIADAAAGFFTVLLKGQAGHAYNVGDEEGELTMLELAKMLVDLSPSSGVHVDLQERPDGNGYLRSPVTRCCPNTAKLRALGWAPRVSLADGFSRTLRSFE